MNNLNLIITPKVTIINCDGRSSQLPGSIGFVRMGILLRYPNKNIHSLCLYSIKADGNFIYGQEESLDNSEMLDIHPVSCFISIPYIDEQYLKEIKYRLVQIIEKIAIAKENDDYVKLARLQKEQSELTKFLREVYNPRTRRIRNFPNDFKKPKEAVAKSIKRAIATLSAIEPELGRFLIKNIKIGYECCYVEDPSVTITVRWIE